MTENELEKIIFYLVKQGLMTLERFTDEKNGVIDYVAIFAKDENEFNDLLSVAETVGQEIDRETAKTGKTFLLNKPLDTTAGVLSLIKIRKPDDIRPQRGAPDFKIPDYQQFKNRYWCRIRVLH